MDNSYFQVGIGGQFNSQELGEIAKVISEGDKLLDYDHLDASDRISRPV